eukprot:TRINITY_DN6795_c0_g1_i2.p1 TRINITY_DN6795_c0_g1~~TRINITY_DN6795_c0_g1_i2.p1  ORF type:complete len:357 (-),score=42.40 TRINITY_DN6795_c0_g1_i2:41-1039(-)
MISHANILKFRDLPCRKNQQQLVMCFPKTVLQKTKVLCMSQPNSPSQWIEQNLKNGKVLNCGSVGSCGWPQQYIMSMEDGTRYFVKTARGYNADEMFEGEALGLMALHDTDTVRVPEVVHYGDMNGGASFIVMSLVKFSGRIDQREFGRLLAKMHLATPKDENAASGKFGFAVDNLIGGTPQPNGWMDNWVDFYRERRLKEQLELAGDSNLMRMGTKVMDNLESFFEGIEIKPSLLHGDLWSGNYAGVDGKPAIFDPAVYYGHHEAEFGMQWCASFGRAFWEGYHELIPRQPGFEKREQLYMLYHYLNHYNLFGSGYYGQCQGILQSLSREF